MSASAEAARATSAMGYEMEGILNFECLMLLEVVSEILVVVKLVFMHSRFRTSNPRNFHPSSLYSLEIFMDLGTQLTTILGAERYSRTSVGA
jgi:hypothetical protein